MQGNENDELYRLESEGNLPENMCNEEIEFRRLLGNFSKDPQNKAVLIQIAETLMSKGLYQEADLYLERYLKLDSENAEALNWSGVVRFSLEEFDNAKSFYKKALAVDPRHRDTIYNLAMLHSAQGEFEEAKEHFLSLTELEPSNPEVFNNLGALL